MNTFANKATVVLVHGAWADGSVWGPVIGPLRQAGLEVVCAPLPLRSLTEDIAVVNQVVERVQGPVILAGHAYGGAPMAGVVSDKVKGLVYVAALAPAEGETVAEIFYREKPHAKAPALAPDERGDIWMSEAGFADAVAPEASAEMLAILYATQRPISVKCIQEKVTAASWRSKRSWYLLAEEDRMISPKTQRFLAERMGATVRVGAWDHTPSITAPKAVVEILLEATSVAA